MGTAVRAVGTDWGAHIVVSNSDPLSQRNPTVALEVADCGRGVPDCDTSRRPLDGESTGPRALREPPPSGVETLAIPALCPAHSGIRLWLELFR